MRRPSFFLLLLVSVAAVATPSAIALSPVLAGAVTGKWCSTTGTSEAAASLYHDNAFGRTRPGWTLRAASPCLVLSVFYADDRCRTEGGTLTCVIDEELGEPLTMSLTAADHLAVHDRHGLVVEGDLRRWVR